MKISSTALFAFALIHNNANAFMNPRQRMAQFQPLAFSSFGAPEFSDPSNEPQQGGESSLPNEQGIGSSMQPMGGSKGGPSSQEKKTAPVIVQGGSLRTWSFETPLIERIKIKLTTEGRPLNADVDLWQGPDNTPQKMAVYVEDGALRPFNAIIETPRGQNTIAVLNTASMEYPLMAEVAAGGRTSGEDDLSNLASDGVIVQGGAIKTYSFGAPVGSAQILLKTDGRPLNARMELLQGPNNNKQVIDVYTEDGLERPFYCIIETPGSGNVIRIVNTATMEYPLICSVDPYSMEQGYDEPEGWGQSNDATFFLK